MVQVGDSIDSWQRFLQLHALVLAWVEEKNSFLSEPLHLTSLVQARQKSHDYNVNGRIYPYIECLQLLRHFSYPI